MKVCLAASGGGHLRQLAQLKPFYEHHDSFLVTQETPLGISLSKEIRTYFVPDIALGKIKRNPKEWIVFARNLFQCLRILRDEKPDLILSTGAGLTFNLLWLSRVFSMRSIFIESIAHVYTPTATGRTMMNRVDAYIVQWEDLHQLYPHSILASPITVMGKPQPEKPQGETFVTVGTHGPFTRLIEEVEKLASGDKIPRPLVIQHPGEVLSSHADRFFGNFSADDFEDQLTRSNLVITHAGTGSIFSALQAGCKTIALPRLAKHGEHYDDHQTEILKKLIELGALLGSERVEDLERLIEESKTFEQQTLRYDSSIIVEKIKTFTSAWFPPREDS